MKPIHSKTDTPPSAGGSTAAVVISNDILPKGIRSSIVQGVNGLDMHILQAGNGDGSAPSLLLLHGFPELAYSWRRIMLPLARAGYHVIAPDQRGYGRTKGWSDQYDTDLSLFRLPALVRDLLALLTKLNIDSVDAVIDTILVRRLLHGRHSSDLIFSNLWF